MADFQYDLAISFAGEQRAEADAIADCLTASSVKVFYDRHEKVDLWGKDLYEHLSDIYYKKAHYCLCSFPRLTPRKYGQPTNAGMPRHELFHKRANIFFPFVLMIPKSPVPLLPTVGYLRYQDHACPGNLCHSPRKLRISWAVGKSDANTSVVGPEPQEFFEQRRKLPDTEILKKVWAKPRWRIAIRPSDPSAPGCDVEQCRQFVISRMFECKDGSPIRGS